MVAGLTRNRNWLEAGKRTKREGKEEREKKGKRGKEDYCK
jgi:hypothetical protein